jgi:hypothetical protein
MKAEVVSESNAREPGHGEAIVPVQPGLGRAARERPTRSGRPGRRFPVAVFVLLGLLGVAFAVFFLLPGWMAEQVAEKPTAAAETAPLPASEPAEPALSAEQVAVLKGQAEDLLAQLLTQQETLQKQHAADWAAEDWAHYQQLSRAGDDAYLAESYRASVSSYSDALDLGKRLLSRSEEIVDRALEAGRAAFDAGNWGVSIEQFGLVLDIDARNQAAKEGLARADRLPGVLTLMEQGRQLEADGKLADAADAYRRALVIDGAWPAAHKALDSVTKRIADRKFDALMSKGLAALTGEAYSDAGELFRAALAVRPGSAEARDGLTQAEEGQKLDKIALAQARALAFERRELWQRAIEQYRAALSSDSTLAFAIEGLARAQARADLDAKLSNLIENPKLLFRDQVLEEAGALLEQARGIADPGPRLEKQIADLQRLSTLASTPVPVQLRSDEQTTVTVYRVGRLGRFAAKEIELRPGTYTAIGSRSGYRDVRETFTVLPGSDLAPISVQCVDPI